MKKSVLLLVALCFVASLLSADGGAERPITAAEKAFYEETIRKVTSLLPEPQKDCSKKLEEITVPLRMGVGAENSPIPIYFTCSYRAGMNTQASMEAGKMLADDASGLEDMSKQIGKISEEMEKAATAGDQKKILELQAKMQAVMQGNAGMAKLQKMSKEIEQQSMQLSVSINANGADFHPYHAIATPAGASLAIRRDKTDDVQSDTVLFFGPYTSKVYEETMQVYVEPKPATGTKVHFFYIQLQGEPEVCDAYIAKMNLAGFAALLN